MIFFFLSCSVVSTLCYFMDCTVHGILQARILEWVAFSFPGDLTNPGMELSSPALQADSLPAEPPGKPDLVIYIYTYVGMYLSGYIHI